MFTVSFTDDEFKQVQDLKEFFKYKDEEAVVKAGVMALQLSKDHIEKRRKQQSEDKM